MVIATDLVASSSLIKAVDNKAIFKLMALKKNLYSIKDRKGYHLSMQK